MAISGIALHPTKLLIADDDIEMKISSLEKAWSHTRRCVPFLCMLGQGPTSTSSSPNVRDDRCKIGAYLTGKSLGFTLTKLRESNVVFLCKERLICQ